MYYLEGQGGGGLHVSLNLERVFTTVAVGGETWGVVGQEKHLQGSVLMVLPEPLFTQPATTTFIS